MHWESFVRSSLALLPVPAAVQRVLAGPIGGTATPHTLQYCLPQHILPFLEQFSCHLATN